MSDMSRLNQLKQKYRSRYYGNRGQDIPDLKPEDNPMSFVNNYLNITASTSDCEDYEDSIITRRFSSARMAGHSSVPKTRQKEAQGSSTKFDFKDKPPRSQGDGHSVTKRDPPSISNALRKNQRESERSNDKMFSDDESNDEETRVVAKLIEESLSESDLLDDKLQNNSHKPREKLYSSDTSVVQEPPSPTSNIQAKKWLSFKDSTFTTNNHAFANTVSGTSEGFTNHAQQLKLQEAININPENPNRADITYDLHKGSPDSGPRKAFVIEEEGSVNLDSWISPFKKKKAPPLSTRPKEDQPTTTPKEKTNSSQASSSLKKKSENVKVSLINSVSVERPTDDFVIEEEDSCDLDVWVSPFKKKKTSPLSSRTKEDNPPPKEKTNSSQASSSLKKKSENVKVSLINSASVERPTDDFVIEEEDSCDLDVWVSPFKKKKTSPLSSRTKEDNPPPKEKTNSSQASSSLKKKSENVKVSLINSASVERPTDDFVIEEEDSCDLDVWVSPFKKKKTSPLSSGTKDDNPTPKKANSVEASSSLRKKSANVKTSLISSSRAERPTDEFVIEEEGSCDLDVWVSPFKKKQTSPSSASPKENHPTPKKTNSVEPPSSLQRKSENVKTSLIISAPVERVVNTDKTNDLRARKRSFANIFFNTTKAGHIGNRLSSVVSEAPAISTTVINEEEFEIEDVSGVNESHLLTLPVKAKSLETGHLVKGEKSGPQLRKTAKGDKDPELEVIKAALPQAIEGVKQQGSSFQDRVVVGIEKQLASSQDADFPQVVEGVERNGSVHPDELPVGNDSHHTDKVNFTHVKQMQQPQQISLSPRTKGDWSTAEIFGDLDQTFTIRLRKGKGNAKSEVSAKKSKQQEEKQEEHLVKEKKSKTKSNKQRKSSRARHQMESAKDCMTNDLRTGEILEPSTIERASRKRTLNNEVVKADMKKNAEANVCRQPPRESLEIDNNDEPQMETDEGLQSKKRKAKMKNICTPCPADHEKEVSVFQSGPVTRQRAVPFAGPVKPLACDLNFAEIESGGEEEQVLTEDEGDEVLVGSDKENVEEHFTGGPKTNKQSGEEEEEMLRRYSIVFDPDTRSDALVECIAKSEKSEFVGSDCCTYWNSFDNDIFTAGKLIIAPKKKSQRRIFVSKIVIYYVEQGWVRVNLHKSERLLKDGDFFFVPPGNCCTISNLQDRKAVLVYNFLNLLPIFTED